MFFWKFVHFSFHFIPEKLEIKNGFTVIGARELMFELVLGLLS
jgi:hypothetical protein